MSSEPLSPVTVNPLPTAVVVADVMRPLESTVNTGTAAAPPYDPAETPLSARVAAMVALAEPSKEAEPVASPEIAKVLDVSNAVAVAALPEVSWLPDWLTPGRLMSPVPSKETPPIVLAVSRAVAEAALPEVSWLPAWFTPGRLMLDVPSKLTPPIVLAFARAVAVAALPEVSWLPAWFWLPEMLKG